MFESSSPKAKAVKSAALVGAVIGAFLSLLVIAWIVITDEFRSEGIEFLLGALTGGIIQGFVITVVFAGIGALVGLVIAASQRLPGRNEITLGPGQPPLPTSQPQAPAGWYPDPQGVLLQRYWDGTAWTEHTAPAAEGR